jgi:hypothetical protein
MGGYFDYGDLKALIIGVIGAFLVLGIQRYWSNWSVKSLQRRIDRSESDKRILDFYWENEAYTFLRDSSLFSFGRLQSRSYSQLM